MAKDPIAELENSIDRFFRIYSARRVALATLVLGFASIGMAWLVYALTTSTIFSILAFGLVGLVSVNVALVVIIPPKAHLKKSMQLLLGAANDRSRIQSIERHKVTLLDKSGKSHQLKGAELEAWESIVLTGFIKNGIDPAQPEEKRERKFTASERRYIEEQKKLMLEREKTMAEEKKRIDNEKARINSEREELKRRDQELQQAEEVAINRLSEVEIVQAELEQMRDNLDSRAETVDGSRNLADSKLLQEREAVLKAKEAELVALKKKLLEDQQIVQSQKTDLNQLKGELLRASEPDEAQSTLQDKGSREQMLEDKLRKLEEDNRKLEERSRQVEEVENSLIDRLNKLSEREASVEQIEINSGLRVD